MSNTPNVTKTYTRGLHNLITQVYDEEKDEYTGEVRFWQGDTQIEITSNQEIEKLPSGNNAGWDSVEGPLTYDIKLTLYDIPLEEYENLFAIDYDEDYGVMAGSQNHQAKYIGLSFDTVCRDNSQNKYVFLKVELQPPDITRQTISDDENAVSSTEINGTAYPVWYVNKNGEDDLCTNLILNSKTHADKYDVYNKGFKIPVVKQAGD